MKKGALNRVREHPNQGLKTHKVNSKTVLWCEPCNEEVDYHRSSVIRKHVNSTKHEKKQKTGQRSQKFQSSVKTAEALTHEWTSMVHAFVSAGIPLNAFRNNDLRTWLQNNLKNGQSLPSVSTLRKKYLPNEGCRDLEETKNVCRDQPVIFMVDETADAKNRKVLNILVKPAIPNQDFRLVRSEILDQCNSHKVIQCIIAAATKTMGIEANNILCLISDNARYMTAAGRRLAVFNERYFHSTCCAHIMHLAAEEIRESLEIADLFISSVKHALIKAPNRREELMLALEKNGLPKKLPPTPVITRWATWFECGAHLYDNFNGFSDWIQMTKPDSKAVKNLKDILGKEELGTQLNVIHQLSNGVLTTIRSLESNTIVASDVWILLQTIDRSIEEVIGTPSQKLRKYIESEHPARKFWFEAQFCDPRKVSKFFREDDTWSLPDSLKIFGETVPPIELTKLKETIRGVSFAANFSVVEFWKQNEKELPNLSRVCLRALSIPPSSAEIERSFSSLKRLLTSTRLNFLEENLDCHLRLQYNRPIQMNDEEEG